MAETTTIIAAAETALEHTGAHVRILSQLTIYGGLAIAMAACLVDAVSFQGVRDEDCATTGDEDGNGAADCDDAACAAAPACAGLREDCATTGDEDGNGAADCDDAACAATPSCAGTCTDGIRNGTEGDVDCGGRCPRCSDGATCKVNTDCDSGLCGGGRCVRRATCLQILSDGFSTGNGLYSIDLDGTGAAPPFVVKCDMTTDGGGWTRFNWVTGAFPQLDPLEFTLSQCAVDDAVCRGRIPSTINPTGLMVKDLGDNDFAVWRFDPTNQISAVVLRALRDKVQVCTTAQPAWQPTMYSGTEKFCGTGEEGGCDTFAYVNGAGAGCPAYTGWYTQLEGDGFCYNAAFKMGMPHTGFETIGCERPEANFLDDGSTSTDDNTGELYFR